MKRNSRLLLTLLLLCRCFAGEAQVDPHFSQYYVYPMWVNPSLAGTMEGSYRVAAIYRNQWAGITNPFSTVGLSADVATNKDINFGASLFNQTAGSVGYQYFNGTVSVAYSGIKFGTQGEQHIAFALQGGMISRRIDPSKLQGGDQWQAFIGLPPGSSTNDLPAKTSSAVFDAGAGVSYYDGSKNKQVNFFGGIAAAHITQPDDPFFTIGKKEKLPVRYTVHGGARIVLSDAAWFVPNALYLHQGSSSETMLGGYLQFAANETTDVMAGLNYRFGDAVVPYAGILFGNLMVGLSYDVNASSLSNYTSANSFEVSVTFMGGDKNAGNGYIKCPRF